VGTVLTMWTVRKACEDGIATYDFGHGNAWYKQFWSNACHDVYRVVAGRGLRALLVIFAYYAVWRLARIERLRRSYRQLRKRLKALKSATSSTSRMSFYQ